MSDIDNSNVGFTGIVDTIYDSKVLKGLVGGGVLPESLRIIKAQVDFLDQSLAGAVGSYPFYDVNSGDQVHLNQHDQLLYFGIVSTTTLTSGGSATVNVGLAAASGASSVVTSLIGGAVAAANFSYFASGAVTSPVSGALGTGSVVQVGGTNQWLSATVATAALTAGVLQVVLMVA